MAVLSSATSTKPHYDLAVHPEEVPDPGDAGTIAPVQTGFCKLVTGGAETRTLADPLYEGQEFDLFFETDGGNCVVTASSAVNQTGNNTLTFDTAGEHIRLVGGRDGAGDREWRVLANDGVGLTTV